MLFICLSFLGVFLLQGPFSEIIFLDRGQILCRIVVNFCKNREEKKGEISVNNKFRNKLCSRFFF